MQNSPSDEIRVPARLKRDKNFQPCPAESGDEHYANGIFEFNITRLLDSSRDPAGYFKGNLPNRPL
jgi:hypothetical protein